MGKYGEPWRDGASMGAVVFREDPPEHLGMRCAFEGQCCPAEHDCITAYGGHLVFESCAPEIRERIILCVNTLAGVSNETLRAHIARGGYAGDAERPTRIYIGDPRS